MSFKFHLLIVFFITATVILLWQFVIRQTPLQLAAPATVQDPPFSISVIRASWGLNCTQNSEENRHSPDDPFTKQNAPYENNVLAKVQELCDGRLSCEIPISVQTLGDDQAPNCTEKELSVEYRCFSYDRPWNAKASTGIVVLNCDKQTSNKDNGAN